MAQLQPASHHISLSFSLIIYIFSLRATHNHAFEILVLHKKSSVMVLSALVKLIYPPPASVVVMAMSAISLVSLSNAGLMEVKGKSMQYSKLRQVSVKEKAKVGGKVGMIGAYTPAFLAGAFSLFIFPSGDLRFTLLRSAITTHFFKRLFEVVFVHKYSGWMEAEVMVTISMSYFLSSATMIYNQQLMLQLPEPAIDLKYIGIPIFLIGIGGNFYHHYLLSKLRSEGEEIKNSTKSHKEASSL